MKFDQVTTNHMRELALFLVDNASIATDRPLEVDLHRQTADRFIRGKRQSPADVWEMLAFSQRLWEKSQG